MQNSQSFPQKTLPRAVFLLVLVSCFLRTHAASFTSSGSGGNWSNAATWGGAGVPGSSDNVTIAHGTTVTVNGNYSCNNLTIGDATSSAATLTVSSTNTLTINGACSINPNNLSSTYTLNASSGTVNIAGTFSWSTSGTDLVEAGTGTLTFTPAITIASSNQSIKLTGAGNINFNSSFTDNYNKLTPYSGGVIKFAGNYTVSTTAAIWTAGTATFTGTGSITANSSLTLNNFQTLASAYTTLASASGTVVISGSITLGTGSTFKTNENFELDGNWTNNGGTFNEGANTITFNGSATTVSGATTFTNIQVGNTASSINVAVTLNSNVTCSGLVINGYNKTRTVTVSSGCTLTVNGNVVINQPTSNKTNNLVIGSGMCSISGNLTFTGTVTTPSYISQVTVTTGSLTVSGAVNFDANTVAANQVITLTSTGAITFANAVNMAYGTILGSGGSGTFNFNGSAPSFTFGGTSGPMLSIPNGCTVNFANGFVINTGAITSFGTSSLCNFSNGTITANADVIFGKVTVSGSNSLASTGSSVRIADACYLSPGASFTALQNLDIYGIMTLGEGSTYMQSAGSVTFYNDIIDSGTISASGSGSIYLVGVNANISGSGNITDASGPVYIVNNKSITSASSLTIGTSAVNTSFSLASNTAISNAGTAIFNGSILGTDSSSLWINSGSLSVTGTLLDTGSLDASSTGANTVTYNGSGYQAITPPLNSYYDLNIANRGLKAMTAPVQVDDAVNLSGSVVVNEGTYALSGGASLNMTDTAVLEMQRSASGTYPELAGLNSLTGGTVIISQKASPATVTSAVYNNLVLTGDNSFDLSGVNLITNNLTLANAAWLNNTAPLTIGNMFIDSSTAYSMLNGPLSASGVGLYAGTLDDGGNTITINGAGGWTNSGGTFITSGITSFNSGSGSAQAIGGNTPTSFYYLQINNAGNVTLNLNPEAPTVVTNFLDLTTGNLITNASNILKMSNGATVVNGSASSYVDGPMTKTGDRPFVFPVGNGGKYGQVGIAGMSAASSEVTAQYFYNPYSTFTKDTELAQVSKVEYWTVVSDDAIQPQLLWTDASSSDIRQCTNLTIAQYNGSKWINVSSGVDGGSVCAGSGSGSISADVSTPASGAFTFGSLRASGGEALPVTLLSFNAVPNSEVVLTNWQTASEVNNNYFTVERSADGIEFLSIGTVKGAGNSASLRSYKWTDENPLPGVSYYRLRQTDFDGNTTLSPMVSVDMTVNTLLNSSAFTLYPNPASDQVSVNLINPSAGTSINIYNLLGNLAYSTSYTGNNSGEKLINIATSGILPSGIYTVSVGTDLNVTSQKLVVQ
jgi:hypothetical protein